MALQIRRGTNAERLLTTPLPGELIYTTDSKDVYVGDGVTLGGIKVSGAGGGALTEEIQDIVGPMFSGGTHSNISFVYNDASGTINASVNLDDTFSEGNTYKISIVGDDSSIIVDSDAKTVTASGGFFGNLTGNVDGNLDNGFLSIVDNEITSFSPPPLVLINSDNSVFLGTDTIPATLWQQSSKKFSVLTGIANGNDNSGITCRISRGTLDSKLPVEPGDFVGYYEGLAYDGTDFLTIGGFGLVVDPNKTVAPGDIPAAFGIVLASSEPIASGGLTFAEFNASGVFQAPIFSAIPRTNSTTRDTEIPNPAEGMIIFNSALQKFQGYVSDTGIAGGGAPNSTPGWVNLN